MTDRLVAERKPRSFADLQLAQNKVLKVTENVDKLKKAIIPAFVEGYRYISFHSSHTTGLARRIDHENSYDPDNPSHNTDQAISALKRRIIKDHYGFSTRPLIDDLKELSKGDETFFYRQAPGDNQIYLVIHERLIPETSTLQTTERLVVARSEASLRDFLTPPSSNSTHS